MVGLGVGRFVVEARRWRSLILESGSAHSVMLLTVGTLACRAIGGTLRNWQSGGAGHAGLVGGQGRGTGVQAGVVGQRSGGGGFFFQAGRSGVCYGRGALVRPNWS